MPTGKNTVPPSKRCSYCVNNHCLLHGFSLVWSGDDRTRTDDPLVANQVLSQLSYVPIWVAEVYRASAASFQRPGLSTMTMMMTVTSSV